MEGDLKTAYGSDTLTGKRSQSKSHPASGAGGAKPHFSSSFWPILTQTRRNFLKKGAVSSKIASISIIQFKYKYVKVDIEVLDWTGWPEMIFL